MFDGTCLIGRPGKSLLTDERGFEPRGFGDRLRSGGDDFGSFSRLLRGVLRATLENGLDSFVSGRAVGDERQRDRGTQTETGDVSRSLDGVVDRFGCKRDASGSSHCEEYAQCQQQ